MKRITATALAILLALNLCVSAFALTLSPVVDKNSVAAGEDVTVTLSLDEAISDVTSLKAKLYFDQDTFAFKSGTSEVSGVTVNKTVQTEKDSGKPYIAVNYIDMSGRGSVPAGRYATVTFTASEAIKNVSEAAFSALIASSLMVDGSSSANTKEVSVSVKVTPASTEVKGYAVAASAVNSSITVNEEARVALKISNKDVEIYNAYYMEVSYDTSILTYEGINTDAAVTDKNGTLKIAGYGDNKTCGTNDIVLTFIGKATGEAKVTVISAKVDARANAAENDAPAATITTDAATITVGGYQVTLPDGFTAAGMVAEPNKDYTFTAKDTSKKYDFTDSTMGGNPVTVTDNGNGSYTVKNVTGPLDIKATALVKINLDNQAGAAIDGITNGQYVKPNTAINFTVTPDADKELEVTVNGNAIEGSSRPGAMLYTIAAGQVTGTELNIVVNYKSSTDTITIIETGDAWSDVTLRGTWSADGGPIDMSTAGATYTLKFKPAADKTVDDYVVTINGTTMELKNMKRGEWGVNFVPNEVAVAGKITIDVSYKKAPEPTVTVDVSEYLNLSGKTMFLITASCTDLAEGKVLAYGENHMYWSAKYNQNNGAYAWLVISDKDLDALKTEATAAITAVDGTKVEIAYNGDVNLTNAADINDAQLVWNMYNAEYSVFEQVSVRKFLEANMTADGKLDTADAAAIIALITNK
mgnify:CR=1 FL=1